jgi:glycosyltransferase involved in cell wall biosynthesis
MANDCSPVPALTVGIAMATYNGAPYLPEQLQSFLKQARLPDELVITDDASTDATYDIVASFARSAPFPVRFERNAERLGSNGNFAKAIAACTSDVILFSDQDDVWLPDHIRRLAGAFEADARVGVAVSNSTYVDEQMKPTGSDLWSAARVGPSLRRRATKEWQFPVWARQRFVLGHGMAIRSTLRTPAFPLVEGWNYDDWFAIVGPACSRGAIIDKPLSLHRHHARQSVGHQAKSLAQLHAERPTLGAGYFDSQIALWQRLHDRLDRHRQLLVDERVLTYIRARISFLERRRDLRTKGPIGRVVAATSDMLAGRYHRQGRGLLTYARDVLG